MALCATDEQLAHYRAMIPPMSEIAKTDPFIVPILEKINACNDVVTLFSCQGHGRKDETGAPYILMLANEAGREKLFELVETLAGISGHYVWRLSLDYSTKKDRTGGMAYSGEVDWEGTYPTVTLRYSCCPISKSSCELACLELLEAVNKVFA